MSQKKNNTYDFIYFQNFARKKENIGGNLETIDIFLLVGAVGVPLIITNVFVEMKPSVSWIPSVILLLLLIKFKFGKPRGYMQHWISKKVRPTTWRSSTTMSNKQFKFELNKKFKDTITKKPTLAELFSRIL